MNLITSIEFTAVTYWDAAMAYEDVPSVTVSPWIEVADALNGMRMLVDELDVPDHDEAVETLRLLHSVALERTLCLLFHHCTPHPERVQD